MFCSDLVQAGRDAATMGFVAAGRGPRLQGAVAAVALALGLAAPISASSAEYCSGPVHHVLSYATGEVMIFGSWRGDWTTVCSLSYAWGGISTAMCKNWYAALQVALAAGKNVTVWYPSSPAPCASLATYGNAPVPGYVSVAKD